MGRFALVFTRDDTIEDVTIEFSTGDGNIREFTGAVTLRNGVLRMPLRLRDCVRYLIVTKMEKKQHGNQEEEAK